MKETTHTPKAGKLTIRALAEELGMSRGDIDAAKQEGLNPYDREAMRKWKSQRNSYGGNSEPLTLPSDESPRLTLEQIEDYASRGGQSKKDIEAYKAMLDVMKAAAALKKERNQVFTREECNEHAAKIGHALQGMFRRMENEIPALCFGKASMGEMKEITKAKVRECQAVFSQGMDEFWAERPEII